MQVLVAYGTFILDIAGNSVQMGGECREMSHLHLVLFTFTPNFTQADQTAGHLEEEDILYESHMEFYAQYTQFFYNTHAHTRILCQIDEGLLQHGGRAPRAV